MEYPLKEILESLELSSEKVIVFDPKEEIRSHIGKSKADNPDNKKRILDPFQLGLIGEENECT